MTIDLSHFSAAVVFALFASIVFGITQRNSADGAGALWPLLLRHVCRRSFCGGMADGADPALIRTCALTHNLVSDFDFNDKPEFHADSQLGNFLLRRSLHSREFYFQEALTSDGMAML